MTDPLDGDRFRLILGDAGDALRTLPDGCIQACVTSPPYWNLRDYQTATWEGGDPGCDHVARTAESMASKNTLGPTGSLPKTNAAFMGRQRTYRDRCGKCGATRVDRQIGLEADPEAYVARLVDVFREVKRVLRPDGTLWLNLADAYANDTKWGGSGSGPESKNYTSGLGGYVGQKAKRTTGLPPKSLLGIPWRVAFALQADSWILRSEITWCKLAPMPESVTDRPTSATEKLFLFSKQPRYFYDAEAVKVPSVCTHPSGNGFAREYQISRGGRGSEEQWTPTPTRNLWNYWVLPPESTPYRHFACMPTRLVEPCVLAGSKPGDLVLDPFAGTGTTGEVALAMGRRFIGIDLSSDFLQTARRRCETLPSYTGARRVVTPNAGQLSLMETE